MNQGHIKTTGAVFKRFCEDPYIWIDGAYLDDASIIVDGRRADHVSLDIDPGSEVLIVGGYMRRSVGKVPLPFFFQSWRAFIDDPAEVAA